MNNADSGDDDSKTSYSLTTWQRLRTVCRVLQQTEAKVSRLKADIESRLCSSEKKRDQQADRQETRLSVCDLESKLELHRRKVMTMKAKFTKIRFDRENAAADLQAFNGTVAAKREEVSDKQSAYIALRESLLRTTAQLTARRRSLLSEFSDVFPVDVTTRAPGNPLLRPTRTPACQCDRFGTIGGVHLPDAEQLAGHTEPELAVALGYVAHVLCVLSRVLDTPLRYAVELGGSRSYIVDPQSPQLSDHLRRLPLFAGKAKERLAFEYAVFLLNKNVAQLRHDCLLPTADARATLDNLRALLQHLCGAKTTVLLSRREALPSAPSSSSAPSDTALPSNPLWPSVNNYKAVPFY